jgi:hypothetical protein
MELVGRGKPPEIETTRIYPRSGVVLTGLSHNALSPAGNVTASVHSAFCSKLDINSTAHDADWRGARPGKGIPDKVIWLTVGLGEAV